MEAGRASTTRRDAVRNRQRIVDVARGLLEADGDASMHSVAVAAGVGQGTLYRHFSTREALVLAVHREDMEALRHAAPDLLAKHPPEAALRAWLDMLAEYGRLKHGLVGAFNAATHAQLADEGYQPAIDAIDLLLRAGVQAGAFRDEIRAEDVLVLVSFLWTLELNDERETRVDALLDVVMNGLAIRER